MYRMLACALIALGLFVNATRADDDAKKKKKKVVATTGTVLKVDADKGTLTVSVALKKKQSEEKEFKVTDKTTVTAVKGDEKAELCGECPRLALGQAAQGKAQEVHLLLCRCKEEVALVARHVRRRHQFTAAIGPGAALDVMTGDQRARIEVARPPEKIGELHGLIAAHAGNGCGALHIG